MPQVGPLELVVVLIIALIVLGPKRLPDVARSVGKGVREFRAALESAGTDEEEKAAARDEEEAEQEDEAEDEAEDEDAEQPTPREA